MSKRKRSSGKRPGRTARSAASRTNRPAPLDLIHRYATPAEVFGTFAREDASLGWLRDADQESVLREVAGWLSRFDKAGLVGWKEIERTWVSETIVEPHRSRMLGLLQGDWMLVSPQSLLIAAKRALTAGHPSDLKDMRPLFMAAVSIQGGLGVDRGPDQDEAAKRSGLLTEIIRSQAFHRRPDWATRIAQSKVRWFDIPRREGLDLPLDVAESFEQVRPMDLSVGDASCGDN